jgi:hypothetical protein
MILELLLAGRAVLDDPLCTILTETELLDDPVERELDESFNLSLLTRCDLLDHHPPLLDAECPRCSEPTTCLAHEISMLMNFKKLRKILASYGQKTHLNLQKNRTK